MIRLFGNIYEAANIVHLAGIRCELDGDVLHISNRFETAEAANLIHLSGIRCLVIAW